MWPAPSQSDWPLYGLVDDVRPALQRLFDANENGALVTLVAADGPSPRPIGSQMLIAANGLAAGYVSGGCVEASLELIGRDVLASGQARRVRFGGDSPFLDVQLVCGTSIELIIEPVRSNDPIWVDVLAACEARRPVRRHLTQSGQALLMDATADTQTIVTSTGDTAYGRLYAPKTRLVVVGSDPVAIATASLAHSIGMEAHLVRILGPKLPPDLAIGTYSNPPSFDAGAHLDRWTAVVTTTHDLESDHQILMKALSSQAFYVGALGSMRKRHDRFMRLKEDGLSPAQTERLKAPVGLDIGAATPYEIAISILADIISCRRQVGRKT
jgi:xanthine dehydrogenase accessory factor